ncbi:hypothetical protein V2J09_020981 [Rumex salicifolius]
METYYHAKEEYYNMKWMITAHNSPKIAVQESPMIITKETYYATKTEQIIKMGTCYQAKEESYNIKPTFV